jgi:hypothetical protein
MDGSAGTESVEKMAWCKLISKIEEGKSLEG